MGRILLPKKMEVVVASAGGVGTTFLINFIAQHRRVNHFDDEDGIKHLPVLPVSFNKELKLIYVYGNPQLAAMSLFRREYHHRQSKKLRKCVSNAPPAIADSVTLEEYAANGIDAFYFRDHFFNWYDTYLSSFPTLFLRYETLFENVNPLFEFLDLPESCLHTFPEKKKRHSAIKEISADTRNGLDLMYGAFEQELAVMADSEIRQGASTSLLSRFPLNSQYLKSYGEQMYFESKECLRIHAPHLYEYFRGLKK